MQASVFHQVDILVETQARAGVSDFALPASVITDFESGGLARDEVYRLIGPEAEIAQRVEGNSNLSAEQTDRASRVAHVVSLAEKVFGKREKAFLWLRLPNQMLGGKRPIDCLAREPAARLVEDLLVQIEYGVFA